MNDLSAFDGDGERERQICDFRVKGKTEAEVGARKKLEINPHALSGSSALGKARAGNAQ